MGVESVRGTMINIIAEGISEDVMSMLEDQGLPIKRTLDIAVPPFPTDITSIDDSQLMDLATKYMENYNFLLTQVSVAELAVTEAENNYKKQEARLTLEKSADPKVKATIIKAVILTDPDMEAMAYGVFKAEAYHKLLKTMMDNLERYYQLTSRELTRRTSRARGF